METRQRTSVLLAIEFMLSEKEFIEWLTKKTHISHKDIAVGIGDDAAVVRVEKGMQFLFTCDTQVEGIHFLRNLMTPQQIGWRAISAAVSDIAAMGGKPLYCLTALLLPKTTTSTFAQNLYRGILAACDFYKMDSIGGNMTQNSAVVIDTFVVGQVHKRPITRSGAQPGDRVYVTGTLGDAALGLCVLKDPRFLSRGDVGQLVKRYVSPLARVKEGMRIAEEKAVTAMIDVSDGLSTDVGHLCDESNVEVEIFADKLPISAILREAARFLNKDALDLALNGGDDYELCFTAKKEISQPVTAIGNILPKEKGRWVVLANGKKIPLQSKGWNHYRA